MTVVAVRSLFHRTPAESVPGSDLAREKRLLSNRGKTPSIFGDPASDMGDTSPVPSSCQPQISFRSSRWVHWANGDVQVSVRTGSLYFRESGKVLEISADRELAVAQQDGRPVAELERAVFPALCRRERNYETGRHQKANRGGSSCSRAHPSRPRIRSRRSPDQLADCSDHGGSSHTGNVTRWRSVGAASMRRSDRTTEGPPSALVSALEQ